MTTSPDARALCHDLALVYLALAYGTDRALDAGELDVIVDCLAQWQCVEAEALRETVAEAMAVHAEEGAEAEVAHAIGTLAEALSSDERRRAMEDLVQIAEADGVLLSSEQSLLAALADTWGVRAVEQRLGQQRLGQQHRGEPHARPEAPPAWGLIHDLALLYVVVAHSTDAELSEPELEAIMERVGEWAPALDADEVRVVLRTVLEAYAEQPDEATLRRSVEGVRRGLAGAQRLVALNDLVYIAHADGVFTEEERRMIASLAQAWRLNVRLPRGDDSR